ncbi:MAG TPA: helix-turn-helix domain-containing protein [Burkholderiaceae bacterium]|nr:helix-turn-helix domain-containing protein [Burkholderiaceae bacterium]
MSYTSYPIRTLADLGARVAQARKATGTTATAVARQSKRSRDILHRLERGDDVSVSSLLDILSAMGYQIELTPTRLPTLDEARDRFSDDDR